MNDHEDRPLSELYQQAEGVRSPPELDDKVLAMAKLHAAENQPKPWFHIQRFGAIASACVVVIAVSVMFIQPNTELPSNDEPRAMSPSLSAERSSFVTPDQNTNSSPKMMASPTAPASMETLSTRQKMAKKTRPTAGIQKIVVVSPESYLDSIEQLIKDNKLADARLRFTDFENQYPQLSENFSSSLAELKMADQAPEKISLQQRVGAIINALPPLSNKHDE